MNQPTNNTKQAPKQQQAQQQATKQAPPAQPQPQPTQPPKQEVAVSPLMAVRQVMEGMASKFEAALVGTQVPATRFVQVAMNAISMNPDLLTADRHSLYTSCMKAATDGLVIDGREAALVTFNCNIAKKGEPAKWVKKVQYMPMVRGLIKLMLQAPSIAAVNAYVIYENDTFEQWVDDSGEHFNYKPAKLGTAKGNAIAAFAMAVLKAGGTQITVMDKDQILKVREVAKDKGVWDGAFWDQQWEKTVLRRLSKRVELGDRAMSALKNDEDNFDLDGDDTDDTIVPSGQPSPSTAPGRTKAAEKVLAKTAAKSAPVQQPAAQQPKQEEAVDAEFEEMPGTIPGDPGPGADDYPEASGGATSGQAQPAANVDDDIPL